MKKCEKGLKKSYVPAGFYVKHLCNAFLCIGKMLEGWVGGE